MKVLITSVGKDIKDNFDQKFGRCEYFQIIDTETNDIKVVENEGKKADHGAGTGASQQAIDENVDVIITGHLGPNAFQILDSSDIKLLSAKTGTVEEVLDQYKKDELEEIKTAGKSHKGMN